MFPILEACKTGNLDAFRHHFSVSGNESVLAYLFRETIKHLQINQNVETCCLLMIDQPAFFSSVWDSSNIISEHGSFAMIKHFVTRWNNELKRDKFNNFELLMFNCAKRFLHTCTDAAAQLKQLMELVRLYDGPYEFYHICRLKRFAGPRDTILADLLTNYFIWNKQANTFVFVPHLEKSSILELYECETTRRFWTHWISILNGVYEATQPFDGFEKMSSDLLEELSSAAMVQTVLPTLFVKTDRYLFSLLSNYISRKKWEVVKVLWAFLQLDDQTIMTRQMTRRPVVLRYKPSVCDTFRSTIRLPPIVLDSENKMEEPYVLVKGVLMKGQFEYKSVQYGKDAPVVIMLDKFGPHSLSIFMESFLENANIATWALEHHFLFTFHTIKNALFAACAVENIEMIQWIAANVSKVELEPLLCACFFSAASSLKTMQCLLSLFGPPTFDKHKPLLTCRPWLTNQPMFVHVPWTTQIEQMIEMQPVHAFEFFTTQICPISLDTKHIMCALLKNNMTMVSYLSLRLPPPTLSDCLFFIRSLGQVNHDFTQFSSKSIKRMDTALDWFFCHCSLHIADMHPMHEKELILLLSACFCFFYLKGVEQILTQFPHLFHSFQHQVIRLMNSSSIASIVRLSLCLSSCETAQQCCICYDESIDIKQTHCQHYYCDSCFSSAIQSACLICGQMIFPTKDQHLYIGKIAGVARIFSK